MTRKDASKLQGPSDVRPSPSDSLTIKDIARLAGVSTATVSKVLNHKDQDIGEDTKLKIHKIINEHNYVPYQKLMKRLIKTATIGLVIPDVSDASFKYFVRGVEDYAYQERFSVIICSTDADGAKELKYIETLKERNVEGILIAPSPSFSENDVTPLTNGQIPIVMINQKSYDPHAGQVNVDYRQGAYQATEYLLHNKHERIGYISGPSTQPHCLDMLEGYKKALYDNGISYDSRLVVEGTSEDDKENGLNGTKDLLTKGITALIGGNDSIARGAYIIASENRLRIPEDLSIIGFGDSYICDLLIPPLTSIAYPWYDMGFDACALLVKQIKNEAVERQLIYEPSIQMRQSVSAFQSVEGKRKERIAIVGSLNMDIMMKVTHIPRVGETILTTEIKHVVGGKGANQAVGAGKLGGDVYMIGRVGNDPYGRELYNSLIKNNVDASGIVFDDRLPTGNAYIYVADNGDNSIVVNPGANSRLSVEQVCSFEEIFDKVAYCLIQMEIPMDTIEYVASICRRKNIKLILNPAPAQQVNEEYFNDCFLVIPNETEIDLMIPGDFSIEEKADKLLEKGFHNVIVTLGEKGCLLVNNDTKAYYPAAAFKAIDTTGAGDSFISGLTVALSEGKDLSAAITFANIAAGITVSRAGAQPSLPDKETIKLILDPL